MKPATASNTTTAAWVGPPGARGHPEPVATARPAPGLGPRPTDHPAPAQPSPGWQAGMAGLQMASSKPATVIIVNN